MPDINYLAIIVAAMIPNILGMIYYGPLLGKQWLSSMGKTQEEMNIANPLLYFVALLTAVIVSFWLKMTIEIVHREIGDTGELVFASTHNFGHGFFHGLFIAIGFVVPVIISLSIFQKNSAKNTILNCVFWMLAFGLMGGILDAWV